MMTIVDGARGRGIAIVDIALRELTWTLDGKGAARGTTALAGIVIEARTSDGVVGRGEASPLAGMSRETLADARAELDAFVARMPMSIASKEDVFALAQSVSSPAARFAIETALLDALARTRGTTIAGLLAEDAPDEGSALAAAVDRMRAIVAGDPAVTLEVARAPAAPAMSRVVDTVPDALAAVGHGARCLKIKIGDRAIDDDVARVRAIAAVAPQATLRLDANRRWPRADVIAHLARFADLPALEYIEEPCAGAHELLREPLPVRIALDESLAELTTEQIFAALESSHLGALVLKPTLLGGFSSCIALASLARLANKPAIVTHTLESPIGQAACRELARIVGGSHAHGVLPDDRALDPAPSPSSGEDRSGVERLRGSVRVHVATPELETVAKVWAALDQRSPIALIHHALPVDEIARRREQLTADRVFAGLQRSPLGSVFGEMSRSSRPTRGKTSSAELDTTGRDRESGRDATREVQISSAELDGVVLFTSGSTADARGVVLSRAALEAAVAASAEHLGWRDDDCWFVPLSLAHAGGLAAVVRCWYANKPIALLDGNWDRGRAVALLERCTLASLVPTQLADLLSDPAWHPPARLRAVLLGGAAASRPLLEQAAARGVPFLTTYGMTESFGQLATAPLDRAGDPDAPLVPLPGVELIGGTREAPAPIRVRAPMLATRYLDGDAIAPDFATRDLGYIENGALVIVGRVDDVIITGGENIHPATVEAVLAATPGVRAALAFAIPDDRWGQIVGAAIATERDLDPAALAAWHAALPAHARPRELAIVRELPVLATGKLDRRAAAQLPRTPIRYG